MKKYIVFLLILICTRSFSQIKDTIYVNDKFVKIDLQGFKSEIKSNLYSINEIDTDSVFYRKLRFKKYYGALSLIKKQELNKFFMSKFKIDTNKVLYIHYLDTLPDISKMYKTSGIIALDSTKAYFGKVLTRKEYSDLSHANATSFYDLINNKIKYVISYDDYKKRIEKEIEEYNKLKNVKILHFYDLNKGYPEKDVEFQELYKDFNLILKNTFTDGMKVYKSIIIYPNGEFFLSDYTGRHFNKKLLKPKFFKKGYREWRSKLKN